MALHSLGARLSAVRAPPLACPEVLVLPKDHPSPSSHLALSMLTLEGKRLNSMFPALGDVLYKFLCIYFVILLKGLYSSNLHVIVEETGPEVFVA